MFHVATDGNDAWTGTLAQSNAQRTDGPLASLAGARNTIRVLRAQAGPKWPVRVEVGDGTYTLTAPLTLGLSDSGGPTNPIVYQAAPGARPDGPPWTIAWCGILRCRRSFEALCALARSDEDRVRVELWGAPALDQIPDFHQVLGSLSNVRFHGAYAAGDLPSIYGACHFAWAIDFYEAGGNSDML